MLTILSIVVDRRNERIPPSNLVATFSKTITDYRLYDYIFVKPIVCGSLYYNHKNV